MVHLVASGCIWLQLVHPVHLVASGASGCILCIGMVWYGLVLFGMGCLTRLAVHSEFLKTYFLAFLGIGMH